MAVTLKDVALAANLHKSTVARALHNDARLSLKTCERVQKLARELGYSPNPLVTALMVNRRRMAPARGAMIAGICDADRAHVPVSCVWLDDLYKTMKDRAAHIGFNCEIFYLEQFDYNSDRLLKILHARGFSGLIWNCSTDNPLVESPLLRHFAIVTCGHQTAGYSSVDFDDFANSQLAVQHALGLGYRRPGIMLWQNHPEASVERCRGGFLNAVRNLPSNSRIPLLRYSSAAGADSWAKRFRPDVIIGNVWPVGPVPKLPYLTLDWIPQLHTQELSCSGVDVFRKRLGSTSVDLVAAHLYHNERGAIPNHAQHVYIPGTWHERPASS